MRLLWKYPGWGWKMYGLLGKNAEWFLGFSKKHVQDTIMTGEDLKAILNRERK